MTKVKITTQSIGTINGVLHVGSTADVEDNIAESWVSAGLAEYVEKKSAKKTTEKQTVQNATKIADDAETKDGTNETTDEDTAK